jgi:hypothetical protein
VKRFWLNLVAGNWTVHREGCRHYGGGHGRWSKDAPPFMALCWLCLRDARPSDLAASLADKSYPESRIRPVN